MQRTERLHPHHRPQTKSDDKYDITDAIRYQKVDFAALIMRISIGGLMLVHGLNKLFYGMGQIDELLASVGLPVFFSVGVLLAEVVAPIMLIIGFKVRVGAFLIAFDMFMATLLVHSADLFKMSEIGGWKVELNALFFLGALTVMFLGSGKFSVSKGRGYLD